MLFAPSQLNQTGENETTNKGIEYLVQVCWELGWRKNVDCLVFPEDRAMFIFHLTTPTSTTTVSLQNEYSPSLVNTKSENRTKIKFSGVVGKAAGLHSVIYHSHTQAHIKALTISQFYQTLLSVSCRLFPTFSSSFIS